MKYIKIYENFFTKIINKWLPPKDESQLIDANWDEEEIKQLDYLGFIIFSTIPALVGYKSNLKDFKIILKKYWDEDFLKNSKLYVYRDTYDRYKKFVEFEQLLKYIEENIPEEELMAKKYNI